MTEEGVDSSSYRCDESDSIVAVSCGDTVAMVVEVVVYH